MIGNQKMKRINPMKIPVQHLRLNKVNKLFYNTKGVKKADMGRFKEAAEYFTKAIEVAPDDSSSYFNRATIKINLGDIPGARSDFALSESCGLGNKCFNESGIN